MPFWVLALGRVTGITFGVPPAHVGLALSVYAATILAFLGGIRWGLALGAGDRAPRFDFLLSVVPQLAGWAALALPDPWRPATLAVLLLVLGPADRMLVRRGLAPEWFGQLRVVLSLGAGAAMFLAAFA